MEIKLSNFWSNFEDFRKRLFKYDKETYECIKANYTKVGIISEAFQESALMMAVTTFVAHPEVFDYTPVERATILNMLQTNQPGTWKSLQLRLQGQLFEKEMAFWGKQPVFKWKRAEAAKGLAAVGAMNVNRPYFCSVSEIPGFHIKEPVEIGQLRNHKGTYISDDENDWYMVFYSKGEAGNLSLTKRFDFEQVEKAKTAFENMFLTIMYTEKHPQFKGRINTTEFISLSI
jgi:1,2-phenylacetyl-CoA epoxidase PaaB subunit